VATAYPGMLAPEDLRGRYQGAEGIAITLAQTAGPALGGFLYAVSTTTHWVSCGVIAVIGAGLILAAKHPGQPETPAESSLDSAAVLDGIPGQKIADQ